MTDLSIRAVISCGSRGNIAPGSGIICYSRDVNRCSRFRIVARRWVLGAQACAVGGARYVALANSNDRP